MKKAQAIVFCLAAFAAAAVIPTAATAQEPLPVTSKPRQGFMIEGVLPIQMVLTTNVPATYISLSGTVPFGIVGYRLPRVAIGLGGSFARSVNQTYAEDNKASTSDNLVLFTPRVEIVLIQGPQAMAEAYIALGLSMGFGIHGDYTSNGDSDYDSDTDFALGSHVGFGGRYFFGGGPFGMGVEFGWTGLFYRTTGSVAGRDYSNWDNSHSLYAAITGQFVF
jgi:hypothetical protein